MGNSALLLTDNLMIWLENCNLSDEKRTTIEFGYSYAYLLVYIRKITMTKNSNVVRFTLGTPSDPNILQLHFSLPDSTITVQDIKTRTQKLLNSLQNKESPK